MAVDHYDTVGELKEKEKGKGDRQMWRQTSEAKVEGNDPWLKPNSLKR